MIKAGISFGLIAALIFGFFLANPTFADDIAFNEEQVLEGDLYKFSVFSKEKALKLKASPAMPVLALHDGYLALVEPGNAEALDESGLDYRLLATNISQADLALDNRMDRKNAEKFEIVYESGEMRVYRVDFEQINRMDPRPQLIPLRPGEVPVVFPEAEKLDRDMITGVDDLMTLISNVSQDSLESYTYRLQAFYRRLAGTDSNYAARDWIQSKFIEFGYDSVYLDPFTSYVGNCYNVVAVKEGSVRPDLQIVVGGHFDGVSGSPAADDNGSGTAATMELARILMNEQTDVTFIFIAFDSEEQGLNGSYHYADNAAANGDSIIYMFNMDMIAHYENTNTCKLYYGPILTYTNLFADLADSLVGITSNFAGSLSGSDHHPFIQNGYEATFLHEGIFSTVYHSYQDSTTYMNFEYMTEMTKAALATVYVVGQTYAQPQVAFNFPGGLPQGLTPDQPTTFNVQVYGVNSGTPVPGSGKLFYAIDGGPFDSTAMTETLPNTYTATIPGTACGNRVQFYVGADEEENGRFYDTDVPHTAASATSLAYSMQDNFQLDQGWVATNLGATSGYWERGVPVDDDGWDYDPSSDADGSGMCYLTQNQFGNTDIDNGAVRLTSPAFDMSLPGTISYDYYLFLTNTEGGVDKLQVEINNNGGAGTWTTIAVHDESNGLAWTHHEITDLDLAAVGVTLSDNMQIRFTANDGSPQSIVEAGIDAFEVTQIQCFETVTVNGLHLYDSTSVILTVDNDVINGQVELIEGNTSPEYEVWFMDDQAQVYQPDTNYYSMNLSVADPAIATVEMTGNWSMQFTALDAGLTDFSIELMLNDAAYYTSPPMPLNVEPLYIVGDANNDGDINVSDAVLIINYVFIGGDPPIPEETSGDANCDGSVNVSDAVMIINFVFIGGNTPGDPNGDGEPDC
jgi:hypothetical protein